MVGGQANQTTGIGMRRQALKKCITSGTLPKRRYHFLSGSLKPSFKFRVGSYRIVYDVIDTEIVILIIAHHKFVYEKARGRKK